MDGFQIINNLLNESRGEFLEFEAEYKSWWKTLKNHMKGKKEIIFLEKCPRFPSEEKLIKKSFKNIDVEVRLSSSWEIDIFTMPGIQSMSDKKRMDMYGWAYWVSYSIPALMKLNIGGVKPGPRPNTAIFPANKCKFIIFVSKGALTELEPEERLAVYLHEIGHWHHTAQSIPFQMREFYEREGRPYTIAYFLTALGIYLQRYEEYDSDLFSIKAGFGLQLSNAFRKMSKVRDKSVANWWIQKSDEATKRAIEYHNRIEDESHGNGSYPSMNNRIRQANEYRNNEEFRKRADKHIDSRSG